MKSERKSLQKRLYISASLIVLITIIATLSFFTFLTNQYRDRTVTEYLNSKSTQAISNFTDQANTVENNIQLIAKWGENGVFHLNDTNNLDLVFLPLIEESKSIFAITIYEESGNEYQISKNEEMYSSRFYSAKDKNSNKAFRWKQIDKKGIELGRSFGTSDYEPGKKIWLNNNKQDTLDTNWHGPYFSPSLNKDVISISSSWKNEDKLFYISIHVLFDDVFGFFDTLQLHKNEYAFLLNSDGDLINLPGNKNNKLPTQLYYNKLITPYYKSEIPEIAEAVNIWLYENKETQNSLGFKLKTKSYWSKFEYLNKERNNFVLGIVVSSSSFSIKIGEGRFEVLLLSLIIVFLGLIGLLFLVLRYNRRIRQIPKPGIDGKQFEKEIYRHARSAESKTLEFKSTIRFNLRSEKNDKAIEQAWLKSVAAFLNTDGGVLLCGVNDAGEFHGIEQDNFENLDKASLHIKNLISKYLGIEYMKFVTIHSGLINNKSVIALVCRQSSKPAYINIANEELFFVRIGPSSTKLSISQAVEHIINHEFKQV